MKKPAAETHDTEVFGKALQAMLDTALSPDNLEPFLRKIARILTGPDGIGSGAKVAAIIKEGPGRPPLIVGPDCGRQELARLTARGKQPAAKGRVFSAAIRTANKRTGTLAACVKRPRVSQHAAAAMLDMAARIISARLANETRDAELRKIVLYRAERHDGRPEMMTLSPVEFLRRWGLLLPPPRKNLVHYYGALAPRSPLRAALTAQADKEVKKIKAAERTEKLKNKARSWAACLARVFEVFPLICPKCRLELKPVAVILDDKELVRLLTHFGLPTEFPQFRPLAPQYAAKRGPPDEDCQLNPLADQYDNIDPPAPED